MGLVVFLSGTTRGATLEGIGRSLVSGCQALGVEFIEISLLDAVQFQAALRSLGSRKIEFVFSFVSMGMDCTTQLADGSQVNLWRHFRIPFISLHGDSPAYFFDRHIVPDSNFVSLYGFAEHCEFRKRLPRLHGPVDVVWPSVTDPVGKQEIDFTKKKSGKLLFLKNGKDPAQLRQFWATCLEPRLLQAMLDLASELEGHLDEPAGNQIDDLVSSYFHYRGFDTEHLLKLRLFFVAQLDDYARAVKSTRLAEALMDFPIEIRGNNWKHLDFTSKRALCIDECDYVKSIDLIRSSLGLIDMSPNTGTRPHDRIMRAYGAYTLCLTNKQQFLENLPHAKRVSFAFEKESVQERVADILAHKAEAVEMGIDAAEAYRKAHPAEQLMAKMLEYAALVRLNNLPQRPMGSQDYFMWPPSSL